MGSLDKKPVRKNKPTKARDDVLDPRWVIFFKEYNDPQGKTFGNALKSALVAGFSDSFAKTITTRMQSEKVGKVEQSLKQALDSLGVTPRFLARKVKTLLNAKVKTRVRIKGDLVSETESEDAFAINAGLKHAIEVRGDKSPEVVDLAPEVKAALNKIAEALP